MSMGRYTFYNGIMNRNEFYNIQRNSVFAPVYIRETVYAELQGYSGWVIVPVAKSKLIVALLGKEVIR
jgi:hypothetical protein